MFKRLAITYVAAILVFTIVPLSRASAHVLVADKGIRAVMHIPPDDKPVSGTPTRIELLFQDQASKLDLRHCDCMLTVLQNGQKISTVQLQATDAQSGHVNVTFPQAAVYTLEVTGKPQAGSDFATFTLDYNERVTAGKHSVPGVPSTIWVGIGVAVVAVVIAL